MDLSKQNAIDQDKTRGISVAKVQNVQQKQSVSAHKIELDHLHAVSMTGVLDVPTFTDKTIVVRLDGETLTLQGSDLAVKNLDIDSGKLQISGKINLLKYSAQSTPTSFAKKIFK